MLDLLLHLPLVYLPFIVVLDEQVQLLFHLQLKALPILLIEPLLLGTHLILLLLHHSIEVIINLLRVHLGRLTCCSILVSGLPNCSSGPGDGGCLPLLGVIVVRGHSKSYLEVVEFTVVFTIYIHISIISSERLPSHILLV